MASGSPLAAEAKPYSWDESQSPPPETLRLWEEVGQGIDQNQTVVWSSAWQSLLQAKNYLLVAKEARYFVGKYMEQIISILVEQVPMKIGVQERDCVQKSLSHAVGIVSKDLEIQLKRNGECTCLNVLAFVFNKKKAFYKGSKANWNVNNASGLPEVRLQMINEFRNQEGFSRLRQYMLATIDTAQFPSLEIMHQILTALVDALSTRPVSPEATAMEDAAIEVSRVTMQYIQNSSDENLKRLPPDYVTTVQHDLQRIFDKLVSSRRSSTYEFYEYWRALILKLITSQSLPLKLFGWQQLDDLLESSKEHRPPPRLFAVKNAGCTFVNGEFVFRGAPTSDGYAPRGQDICYERTIPETDDGGGKKLTLFRCTMRSAHKWWFLSEADEEQPGTDRDIDYYQHKSQGQEEAEPPPAGWLTCPKAGVDPPPNLVSVGLMVPAGEEFNTLEHQLAKWAIEKGIIELVLGDSVHREIVSRSTTLIEFLASMCERDVGIKSSGARLPNQYCLKTSHLLTAWKTCTKKADAAVSAQVYQLLVSILPSCPVDLAVPLLQAMQNSLMTQENGDHLSEVADFCTTLACSGSSNSKSVAMAVDVRSEVLELLWSVLTHPEASSLKTYDTLKQYVTNELRVVPKGHEQRESYLHSCTQALSENSKEHRGDAGADETHALQMVKLTHFVLEACPRDQSAILVMDNRGALPLLMFDELIAFLKRRHGKSMKNSLRTQSFSVDGFTSQEQNPLSERLRILRYAYGLNDSVFMSMPQLNSLWQLCCTPSDREQVMIFIASASGSSHLPRNQPAVEQSGQAHNPQTTPEDTLSAAFGEAECASTFFNLFCSSSVSFKLLGEGAYRSFHFMFNKLRLNPVHGTQTSAAAVDTLWRICLVAENNTVAAQAMKDLLAIYIANTAEEGRWTTGSPATDQMQTESQDEAFGKRAFDCLKSVKKLLDKNDPAAEIAVERCLQILNAAIGQGDDSGSLTASTLIRLTSLTPTSRLSDTVKKLPHGMRGQACYRKVGIMVKRAQAQNGAVGPQQFHDREVVAAGTASRNGTVRFSLDIHPIETMHSLKRKVAAHCQCQPSLVRPISVSGRATSSLARSPNGDSTQTNLSLLADSTVVEEVGIAQGCEIVFVIAERHAQQPPGEQHSPVTSRNGRSRDLSRIFVDSGTFTNKLFSTLLDVLEALPRRGVDAMEDVSLASTDTHKLVWDLLLAMPTNPSVATQVHATTGGDFESRSSDDDAMEIDTGHSELWSKVLDIRNFHRSVYVLLAVDAFLQPATEVLSCLQNEHQAKLEVDMKSDAEKFRRGFIESGGFEGVIKFFATTKDNVGLSQSMTRMSNAVALRILKCCLFGNVAVHQANEGPPALDQTGARLLQTLSDSQGLLSSLAAIVVGDPGTSIGTISDVLEFLHLLLKTQNTAQTFIALPNSLAEQFLVTLLLWDGNVDPIRPFSSVAAATKVRKHTHDLILDTPALAECALPWLTKALPEVDNLSESTVEYFDVLQKLVPSEQTGTKALRASIRELSDLALAICKKLASCPRPSSEMAAMDCSTGVLCGCLAILRALIESQGGSAFKEGTSVLLSAISSRRWSETNSSPKIGMFSAVSQLRQKPNADDLVLIDLMGVVFDGFLSPGGSSSIVSICCDKQSRQKGFDVVGAAARACKGIDGYLALVTRVNGLMSSASPYLKHRWGLVAGCGEMQSRSAGRSTSKYSGLRNQGCTCYMNSVLQQLFMMPELRHSMCLAPLPSSVRSSGGVMSAKGAELVNQKLSLQWENGVSYDAMVEGFSKESGMHLIRYCPMPVATIGTANHQQVRPEDIDCLPPVLQDEFILKEGRPCKETGIFEVVTAASGSGDQVDQTPVAQERKNQVEETEEEALSRHLMEEVQRTFIHLDEGSRGRCFDPRSLVEACACLKLEFDVWQQNDASEFATKLLDRLETSLKKWAPAHFHYLDHTFGLKQTKQKICKQCGLKSNREEKLLNVDCQIRGKTDIHEALGSMTENEIMEGNNQVFCDRCKKNTDTILRTAISTLPNMLILSLKRFDLDYNTFETVKLNSRCAFGQTLNMKRYTLDGIEAMEQAEEKGETDAMDLGSEDAAMSHLPDDDYEYRLAGVLVHAGVAQGGHYYSFIKDRSRSSEEKWYRFDDEDVTPFDPSAIEVECFGGKVKKETKWPNGQVHTTESEQYANALMLFYEKVKQTKLPPPTKKDDADESKKALPKSLVMTSGYDVFEPDVQRSNSTHRWQTFLFDDEFQRFLKGLLGLCRTRDTGGAEPTGTVQKAAPWRGSVVQMLLAFFFDIFLYTGARNGLGEWVRMLEDTLNRDPNCARAFLVKVASKTREVSGNWLRTFLSDCPDQMARVAAVRVFTAAFHSCITFDDEQKKLKRWAEAWKQQLASIQVVDHPLPLALTSKWKTIEDTKSRDASSLGIILSFLNVLLELSPRNSRYYPELTMFIRNLTSCRVANPVIRDALIEALVPARMMALVTRERSPNVFRAAFPGSSVSMDVADSQVRTEQNPSHQMMTMGGNQSMSPMDVSYRGSGTPMDYYPLFESLCALLGLEGAVATSLTVEVNEHKVGRGDRVLSKAAVTVLGEIFREACAQGEGGMGQTEIEAYIHRCGVDSVPTQKIHDIMAKYPSPSEVPGASSNNLGCDGFLAYYRETVQTTETRVRNDLHVFGYRPDLSRRSTEARMITTQGRQRPRFQEEMVSVDVASQFKEKAHSLGAIADLGLSSFHLYHTAFSASEPLAQYLLAGAMHRRDCRALIISTLKAIYHAPAGWVGNETLRSAQCVLRVLASIPDTKQRDRISLMMQCTESPGRYAESNMGMGLILAARSCNTARSTTTYPNDMDYAYEQYVSTLKELYSLQPVYLWMSENRNEWAWMERDLDSTQSNGTSSTQVRRGYPSGRVGSPDLSADRLGGTQVMNESDDEDESLEEMDTHIDYPYPSSVTVQGAGHPDVNGVYGRDGMFESTCKYSRTATYKDQESTFALFRCNVSNNTKHWYISIVPAKGEPGTSSDVDFYSAPAHGTQTELPPRDAWTTANDGISPAPTVICEDGPDQFNDPERQMMDQEVQVSPFP